MEAVVVPVVGGLGELVKKDGGCSAGEELLVAVVLLGDVIGCCPDDRVCCFFNAWFCSAGIVEL